MHDLIIKGGTLVDGTGAPGRTADVAVDSGRITDVGRVEAGAARIIDADGLLVTPGWVDVHTHYDGQVTWDSELAPTSWHGVTTLVMGNCGVGFAPAAPDRHDWLIGLMEGVEDIPGTALAEGIEWEWETFPEYLDALERRRWTVDVGTQVPHAAVRAYVMGERGARNEAARADEIAAMRAIVLEALRAGALGFSTSRTTGHRASRRRAGAGHLRGRGRAVRHRVRAGRGGHRRVRAGPSGLGRRDAPGRVERGRLDAPALGRHRPARVLRAAPARRRSGAVAQAARGVARRLRRGRPPASPDRRAPDRDPLGPPHDAVPLRATSRPTRRCGRGARRPTSWPPRWPTPRCGSRSCRGRRRRRARRTRWRRPTGAPSCWGTRRTTSPGRSSRWPRLAAARGISPLEVAYDEMARDGGQGLLYIPILNYATGDLDHVREMMLHPQGLIGLADGGAHTGTICDASMPTFMLTHWTRDRSRGATLPLEYVVKKQTHDTARLYGMSDRGTVEPGALGDFNLIDYDGLCARCALRPGRSARGRVPVAPEGRRATSPRSRRGRSRSSRARRPASCPVAWCGAHADLTSPRRAGPAAARRTAPHRRPVRHGRLQSVCKHR